MTPSRVLASVRRFAPLPLLLGSCLTSMAPYNVSATRQSARVAALDRPPIYAFSDSRTLPTVATLLARLPAARGQLCATGQPAPLTSPTLDQALATIHAFLLQAYGAKSLAVIDKGPHAHDAYGAEHIAAGGVLGGAPGAALEALLLAHKVAPTDLRPLVNAAALLPDVGLANEALAFLDAADRLSAPKGGAPLGMSLTAISRNNRGYALLKLRRWREAQTPLREAIARSPLLTEADLNLGEALLCAGDDGQAARFFVAGGRRNTFRGDALVRSGTPPTATDTVRADELFDLSAGIERQLPSIPYPATPQKALALRSFLSRLEQDSINAAIALRNRQLALFNRVPTHLNALTMQRTQDILGAVRDANQAPPIRDLAARVAADVLNVHAVESDYWDRKVTTWQANLSFEQFTARCASSLPTAYQQWLGAINVLDRDERLWWKAYTKYTTGLAANLANLVYHALAEGYTAEATEGSYVGLLATIVSWISFEAVFRGCVGKPAVNPDVSNWSAPTETPPASDCGPGIAAPHNLLLTLPPPFDYITIKANCESVTTQVESPEPGVKGFIAVTQDLKRGETTVVIGPKVGVSVPGSGIGAGFETGVYITRGSNGVKDWGISLNPTGSTSLTPNGLVGFEANAPVTISLVGAIDYIPTAFGFTR